MVSLSQRESCRGMWPDFFRLWDLATRSDQYLKGTGARAHTKSAGMPYVIFTLVFDTKCLITVFYNKSSKALRNKNELARIPSITDEQRQ